MKSSLNLWLLLVVSVFGLSLWFGPDLIRSGPAGGEVVPAAPREVRGEADPEVPLDPVHLVVLNGTAEAGLARDCGLLLAPLGCVVERVGNAPHAHFGQTILINRQLAPARARRLAAELGDLPILREFDRRAAADAVLVLGQDAEQLRERWRHQGRSEW